jgi:hypothetical protein
MKTLGAGYFNAARLRAAVAASLALSVCAVAAEAAKVIPILQAKGDHVTDAAAKAATSSNAAH